MRLEIRRQSLTSQIMLYKSKAYDGYLMIEFNEEAPRMKRDFENVVSFGVVQDDVISKIPSSFVVVSPESIRSNELFKFRMTALLTFLSLSVETNVGYSPINSTMIVKGTVPFESTEQFKIMKDLKGSEKVFKSITKIIHDSSTKVGDRDTDYDVALILAITEEFLGTGYRTLFKDKWFREDEISELNWTRRFIRKARFNIDVFKELLDSIFNEVITYTLIRWPLNHVKELELTADERKRMYSNKALSALDLLRKYSESR